MLGGKNLKEMHGKDSVYLNVYDLFWDGKIVKFPFKLV
jgi:hypothetical protein